MHKPKTIKGHMYAFFQSEFQSVPEERHARSAFACPQMLSTPPQCPITPSPNTTVGIDRPITEQPVSAQPPQLTSLSKVPHITSEPVYVASSTTNMVPDSPHRKGTHLSFFLTLVLLRGEYDALH